MTNCRHCHKDYDEADANAVDRHTTPVTCSARRTCRCQGRPTCYPCGDSICLCSKH